MAIYLTKEEADKRIDEGDVEIINGLLSGEVVIGEQPVEETVEEEEVPTEEQPVVEEAPVEEANEQDDRAEIARKYKEEAEKRADEAKKAAEEAQVAAEARQKLESLKLKSVDEAKTFSVNMPEFEEDETDKELAGSFSVNNRKILDTLKESLGGAASVDQVRVLEEKLNAVLQIEEEKRKREEQSAAERAERERKNKLFSDVDAFGKKYKPFDTGKPTSQMFSEINDFKMGLKQYLQTEDNAVVEVAYRKAINGTDDGLVKGINSAGIKIPDGADKYIKLAEIVDLKNGVTFNEYSGKYETVTDEFGNRVILRSLEDAYKLSRFNDLINEAKKEQVEQIQQTLSNRENSAVELPDTNVDGDSAEVMSIEEKEKILSLPNSAFRNNPELLQKLNKIIGK